MPSARQSVHHHILAVAMAAAFLVASIGIMGAATRMSGAIISQGSLVVESSVKKVQHPSGGVAKKLLVEDGARVAKDDLLILMDETVAQANLTAVTKSLWELEARRARLQAERDGDAEIGGGPPQVGVRVGAEVRDHVEPAREALHLPARLLRLCAHRSPASAVSRSTTASRNCSRTWAPSRGAARCRPGTIEQIDMSHMPL